MVDFYNHVKHCTTHPKFLHSNSTSHRWVFGAIAELIDNAIDPDVSASQFCIDMKEFGGEPCLVFMDNGCGLVPEKLHKMLSFGHSKKQMTPGDRSIGKHGNGFKSGTMRLGRDVLVLTKCADSMTAGFLSQTFLADTGAEDILIPQVSWDLNGHRLSPMDLEIEESLRAICKFSIFPDEDSLLAQLEAIPVTGAILIISNLRRHEGVLELDFETDPHDIRIASEINSSHFQQLRPNQPNTTEVPMDYSLRAYVSILYKVPRMQVFIRDKKVKTKRIAGILSQKETESYKPYGVAESIKIELGFNTENKSLYGMMLYHRNRLIKAYMRVGMQLEENERGMGVIGLAEADFLHPTHNKQDFDDTTAYRRLLKKLSDVLAEYWWEKKERVQGPQLQLEPRAFRRAINLSTSEDIPDVIWVQCDNPACLKWRILPSGTDVSVLPDIWYCEYHPEEKFRNHEEPEQEWDPSVQHEIIERRRERKREYDREKKEREAERKRQRLEAATKDNQEILQKQREALEKEVQLQEARGEVAQKDLKLREEELKKMSEEYAAVLAASDELKRQLELTKAELYRKDKEKESTALLLTQQVHLEEEVQEGPLAVSASMNGHVEEEQDEPAFLGAVSNKEGGSMRKHPQDRERTRRRRLGVSRNASVLPVSASPPVHQATVESNGNLHGHVGNGGPPLHNLGNSCLPAAPPRSPVHRPRDLQASQPLHIAQTSLVTLSKELIARRTSGGPQQSQRKGTSLSLTLGYTGVHVASTEHRKRSSKAGRPSQPAAIELPTLQEVQYPSPALDVVQRVHPGEVPPVAVGTIPPIPVPSFNPTFTPIPCQATNSAMLTAVGYSSDLNQRIQQAPTTGLPYRCSELADSAHQDLLSPPLAANGASFEHRCEDLFSEQDVDQSSESHEFRDVGNGRHIISDTGAPLSGLRLALPQQHNSMSLDSGMISVHLPMDSMLSTSNSRSEAEITLDKAVFSLQRRLRLTLNTLLKLGGSGDSNLIELDGLPSQDSEVVSICEKANQHVETMMQNGRQEAAKLKAELAYLMADKMQILFIGVLIEPRLSVTFFDGSGSMDHGKVVRQEGLLTWQLCVGQHGQGRNFKIQSIANRWGIGMEVSKQG